MVNKLVRKGKIAVLVSPCGGSGWFEAARFDPEIVKMLETGDPKKDIEFYCTLKYPNEYLGGLRDLEVQWVPVGEYFYIHEYDGSEWIVNQEDFYVAR
jgi:hypothetical protein